MGVGVAARVGVGMAGGSAVVGSTVAVGSAAVVPTTPSVKEPHPDATTLAARSTLRARCRRLNTNAGNRRRRRGKNALIIDRTSSDSAVA